MLGTSLVGDHRGEAYPGRTHLSGDVLRRCSSAAGTGAGVAVESSDPYRFSGIANLPCRFGIPWRQDWWCAIVTPVVRVTFWGALAMALTAGMGAVVGTVV
jgi:hypothetical protein